MKLRNFLLFILFLGMLAGAMYLVARYNRTLVEPEAVLDAPADSTAAAAVDTGWVEVDTVGTVGP